MMANGSRVLPACPLTSATVDPEVRQFVISQLVVIALPVGTLFGIWLWMLNCGGRSRRDQLTFLAGLLAPVVDAHPSFWPRPCGSRREQRGVARRADNSSLFQPNLGELQPDGGLQQAEWVGAGVAADGC